LSTMPRLFENLWAKLAALLLAFLLWFHVATNKVYQHEITLKLTQVDIAPDLALVESPPDKIAVMVEATGKRLLRSDWKKGGVKLIVDRNRAGRYNIILSKDNTVLVNSDGIELVDIVSPREVTLNLDALMEKEVAVESRVIFVPDKGYTIMSVDSIIPGTVTVTGSRNHVRAIKYIETVSETHEGIRNNLTMEVPLVYPEIYGLTIEPDTVEFIVNVVPLKTRVFSDVRVAAINTPPGRNYEVSPDKIEIRAGGPAKIIDSLASNLILAEADFSLADSSGLSPIKIVLPRSISLLYKSVDSVKIIEK